MLAALLIASALQIPAQFWASGYSDRHGRRGIFMLGAILTGVHAADEARLMSQAGPAGSVLFHNFADEVGPMGVSDLQPGPLSNVLADYLREHDKYEPADARYLQNHKGHLMYVRPEETHVTPELVKAATFSGTRDELVERLRAIDEAGYTQVTVQVVHGHEGALEDWAEVFDAV